MLRNTLRSATQDAHNALHEALLLKSITDARMSVSAYKKIILCHASFYNELESHLHANSSNRLEYSPNFIDWISQDIKEMGLQDYSRYPIPSVAFKPSFSAFIGFSYVKLGSMFGASVICKRLAEAKIPSHWTRFFRESSAHRPVVWPQFLETLEAEKEHINEQEAVRAATTCFKHFKVLIDNASTTMPSQVK